MSQVIGRYEGQLLSLIDELNENSTDPRYNPYFQDRYLGHIHAVNLALKYNSTEAQYKVQYEHVRNNLTTLKILWNREYAPIEVQYTGDTGEFDLEIPESEGQVCLVW